MRKALIIATVGCFLGFERNNIKLLQSKGYEVHCASNFTSSEMNDFHFPGIIRHQVDFERSPFSKSNISAYRQLKEIFRENTFQIVHCHTPVGGALGRLAARNYSKTGTKVFYTAHGFHFFKGAPIKNWLLYYPIEWVCANWTDVLITINKEDYAFARRHMHAGQVEYVPGVGIDIKKFSNIQVDKNEKRKEIGVPEGAFFLLSVGELNENKNHATVIHAVAKLKNKNIHYVIAGNGQKYDALNELADQLNIGEQVHLLGFRTDAAELYKAADVFVHPSFREGLPVAVMEAMAVGLPCIVSKIRGNEDLIEDGGFLCEPGNVEDFVRKINILCKDVKGRELMGKCNQRDIKNFDVSKMGKRMQKVYPM